MQPFSKHHFIPVAFQIRAAEDQEALNGRNQFLLHFAQTIVHETKTTVMGVQRSARNWLTVGSTLIQRSWLVANFLFGFWQLCLSSAQRPGLVTQLSGKSIVFQWLLDHVACSMNARLRKEYHEIFHSNNNFKNTAGILKSRSFTSSHNNKLVGQMKQKMNRAKKKMLSSLSKSDFTCMCSPLHHP